MHARNHLWTRWKLRTPANSYCSTLATSKRSPKFLPKHGGDISLREHVAHKSRKGEISASPIFFVSESTRRSLCAAWPAPSTKHFFKNARVSPLISARRRGGRRDRSRGFLFSPLGLSKLEFFHFARRQGRKDVGAGDARAFQMEGARLGHPSYTYTPASFPKIPPKNKRFLRVFFGYFRVRCRGMCVGWVAQNQVKNSVKLCEKFGEKFSREKFRSALGTREKTCI